MAGPLLPGSHHLVDVALHTHVRVAGAGCIRRIRRGGATALVPVVLHEPDLRNTGQLSFARCKREIVRK